MRDRPRWLFSYLSGAAYLAIMDKMAENLHPAWWAYWIFGFVWAYFTLEVEHTRSDYQNGE